jgi:twitching motility protein PilT
METLTLDDDRREKISTILTDCPLFKSLKPTSIPQILKVAEGVRFEPDELIIKEGDPSDSFFVILGGEASIRVDDGAGGHVEIGRLPEPASFGEIGLLLGEKRTASVFAAGELEALRFSSKIFESMSKKVPDFDMGLCRGLARRLQQVSGMIPLPHYDTRKGAPPNAVVDLLPAELRQRHRVLPLEVDGPVLTLGLVDDPSPDVMSALREHLASMELKPVHIDLQYFNEVMRAHSGIKEWTGEIPKPSTERQARSPQLDAMLERMVAEGASDLHLHAGHKPYWRIDGDIRETADAPALGADDVMELLSPALSERNRRLYLDEGDTDFAYSLPSGARFRVSLYRDRLGGSAVFRLIPSNILTLDQLGMPPVLKTFCEMPKGLVLVTGPTGSGKSTTLAAMVDHIKNTRKSHIITLEDPIEFVHQSGSCLVTQRDIGVHASSFARGLRAALREDPDVVLVGEMRDLETISMALETANTGHLVLGTLHTNTAVSTVDRIVDQFPAGQQSQIRNVLADVLRGVVTQTLLKKASGGRMAILEVLVVNFAVANLIRESKTVQIPNIMQTGKAQGMSLLNDELTRLIDKKQITLNEALSAAVDKKDLQWRFRSGVTVAADTPRNDRFRVVAVEPGTPGAQAGLQRGQVIVEIDGRPAREYTLDDARKVFRTDGQHIFAIERGGKRTKLTMQLEQLGLSTK